MTNKRILRWSNLLFATISLLCFLSVFISPSKFWPAVFASYAIPAVLIFNLLWFVFILFVKIKKAIYPLIVLLGGIPFFVVTYSWHEAPDTTGDELTVLGLNAKLFRKSGTYHEFFTKLISWVAADSSDIKCIQEYSTNAKWEPLDVTKKNIDAGYYAFTHRATMEGAHNPGLAIFSKYPIIDTGSVWIHPGSMNDGIFADIDLGNDTIRIYNVHLESMKLLLYQYKNTDNYLWKIKRLVSSLKNSAEQRSFQIDQLVHHTSQCPYPFIICGDFNETPYSYNYFRLRNLFSNAFEEAGRGFGFSFNGILFFLRIDHHFYGPGVETLRYQVDRSIKISDHFATRGSYHIAR